MHTLATLPRTLSPGHAHLYIVVIADWLPVALDVLQATISAEEQTRMRRFRQHADQERFLVAHGTLRLLLGRHLDREPVRLAFRTGARGKPWIATDTIGDAITEPPLHFNLAHAGGVVVIGIAERPLGVDVEMVPATTTAPDPGPAFDLTQQWVRHEALQKATGLGLGAEILEPQTLDATKASPPLRVVDISLASNLDPARPEQTYAASVAMDASLTTVCTFRLVALSHHP